MREVVCEGFSGEEIDSLSASDSLRVTVGRAVPFEVFWSFEACSSRVEGVTLRFMGLLSLRGRSLTPLLVLELPVDVWGFAGLRPRD
jgi:hypothetical protein